MNVTLIIIGFLVVFFLAYAGNLSKDIQALKRLLKSLFIIAIFAIPAQSNAQFWGKFEPVGTIHAHDPDTLAPEIYYTITAGNSEKVFVIAPCSGIIKADTNIYGKFTYSKTYYLTCRATDQAGLYSIQKVKIVLTKQGTRRKPPQFYVL